MKNILLVKKKLRISVFFLPLPRKLIVYIWYGNKQNIRKNC